MGSVWEAESSPANLLLSTKSRLLSARVSLDQAQAATGFHALKRRYQFMPSSTVASRWIVPTDLRSAPGSRCWARTRCASSTDLMIHRNQSTGCSLDTCPSSAAASAGAGKCGKLAARPLLESISDIALHRFNRPSAKRTSALSSIIRSCSTVRVACDPISMCS
jgi:hypothetical protein